MTQAPYAGIAATRAGQAKQVTKAFRGIATELKRKQINQLDDSDHLNSLSHRQLVGLVLSLQNQLADAQALLEESRTAAYSDAPAAIKYDDCKTVAKRSGVAICTICRNADTLGGIKLGGDWLFPTGTTYGKRRQRK